MDQGVFEYPQPRHNAEIPQERFDWYRLNSFLIDVGRESQNANLAAEDLIHVGGASFFYHTYKVFGSKTVMNFRGTHDLDFVSFSPGSLQQILDMMKSEGEVKDYKLENSHFPDKKKVLVELKDGTDPAVLKDFTVDYWESSNGEIHFNKRVFTPKRLVLDPPVLLELATLNPNVSRGVVSVPSLRDSFILKMDVVENSRSGLRTKDRMDLLTALPIADGLGYDFRFLLQALKEANSYSETSKRLKALEETCRFPNHELSLLGRGNPAAPTSTQLERMIKYIGYAKEQIE